VKTAEAIAHFRSVRALAEALDISVQAVYDWGEEIPTGRAYQLQVITDGKLMVAAESSAREASA
jgi:hypothetical protein